MAIYKTDAGEYVISSNEVWLPGVYATDNAARYAFKFPDKELHALQERKKKENGGTGGVITFADLQTLRRGLRRADNVMEE